MNKKFCVSLGFGAMLCVLGWYDRKLCLWFLISLLSHELGHVCAIVCCGIPIWSVSLKISGAVIEHGFCTYWQELLCAAAGPVASIVLCVVVYRILPELAILSGMLAALNLLPLFPLDGGRMLRACLLVCLEEEKALRVVKYITWVVCCSLMVAVCCITASLRIGIWPIFALLAILWRVGCAGWAEK